MTSDFKGRMPRIEVTTESTDEADSIATQGLIELYTQPDGFHCPRCDFTTSKPDEAVAHLAEEMNKALAHLSGEAKD